MTARHADTGQHSFRDEALIRATITWDNTQGIERPRQTRAERRHSQPRTVVWAPDRYVPIGVIEGAA